MPTDKERIDWMESDWNPRSKMRPVLKRYETEPGTLREFIDAAIRASRRKTGGRK